MYGLYLPNSSRPQCFGCWSHTAGWTSLHHLQWHDYWHLCLHPDWNLCRQQQHQYHPNLHCQCRRNYHPGLGWAYCHSSRLGCKQLCRCHLGLSLSHAPSGFHLLERLELWCWESRSLTVSRGSDFPGFDHDHQGCHTEWFDLLPVHRVTVTSDGLLPGG